MDLKDNFELKSMDDFAEYFNSKIISKIKFVDKDKIGTDAYFEFRPMGHYVEYLNIIYKKNGRRISNSNRFWKRKSMRKYLNNIH